MNKLNHLNMYNELMTLCDDLGKFYFADRITNCGTIVRIFSYHVAQYSDWLLPSALESRGIMFQLDENREFVRLLALPDKKFFNDKENPITENIDYSQAIQVMDKADGSYINSFPLKESFSLKSKTSLHSDQALGALDYINKPENRALYSFVEDCAFMGITVNMEYTAPNNRIVLEYKEVGLTILNLRDNSTGEHIELDTLPQQVYNSISKWLVENYDPAIASDPDFVANIKKMTGIEGVVVRLPNIQTKIKTDWYVNLHRHKNSVSNPKHLVTTILQNHHDDLYALFSDDLDTINRIREFELHVVSTIQNDIASIVKVMQENKHKSRKEYAVNGKRSLTSSQFYSYMPLYDGSIDNLYQNLVDSYLKRPVLLVLEKYLITVV